MQEATRVAEQVVQWYSERGTLWEGIPELREMVNSRVVNLNSVSAEDDEAIHMFGYGRSEFLEDLRGRHRTGFDALQRIDTALFELRSSLGRMYRLARAAGVITRVLEAVRGDVAKMAADGSFAGRGE
jgi:hypothetical protein